MEKQDSHRFILKKEIFPETHNTETKMEARLRHQGSREKSWLGECVTVKGSPLQLFTFWRNFSNLPFFMKDISRVEMLTAKTSHWVVDLPRGPKVEWKAEVTKEIPGEMISWRTIGDHPVHQEGTVWFKKASGNRGTVVTLSLNYSLPGGKLTEMAIKLFGEDPQTLILKNLRYFKAFIETGEVPTVDGQTSGRDEESDYNETH